MKIISNEWKLRYVIIVLRNKTQWTKMIQHHFTISTYCPQSIVLYQDFIGSDTITALNQGKSRKLITRKFLCSSLKYGGRSLIMNNYFRGTLQQNTTYRLFKSYIETGNVKGVLLDEEEIFVKQWNTLFDCDLTVWRRSSSESETLIWILCVLCFFDAIVHAHFYSYFFVLNYSLMLNCFIK